MATKKTKKTTTKKLKSAQEFLEQIDWEGGIVDALVYYGVDATEYAVPNAQAINAAAQEVRKAIDLMEGLVADIEVDY